MYLVKRIKYCKGKVVNCPQFVFPFGKVRCLFEALWPQREPALGSLCFCQPELPHTAHWFTAESQILSNTRSKRWFYIQWSSVPSVYYVRDELLHFEIKIPEELRREGKMWVWDVEKMLKYLKGSSGGRPDKNAFWQNKAYSEAEIEESGKKKKKETRRKKSVKLAGCKDYLPHYPRHWHPHISAH